MPSMVTMVTMVTSNYTEHAEKMISTGGNEIKIGEAAKAIGISVSTLRRYIRNNTFPPPKRKFQASQSVAIFNADYIQNAKDIIDKLRVR